MIRFGGPAKIAAALVLVLFLLSNLVPDTNRPGRPGTAIRPPDVFEWCRLIFIPSSYRDLDLRYGFPAVCYRRQIIDGQTVQSFYGSDHFGWQAEQTMENLLLAVLSATFVGWMVQRVMRSTRRAGKLSEPPAAEGAT
jgi:hypothetical protein